MKKSLKLFTGSWEFFAGAAKIEQIPKSNLVEFAFIGRSNVGKSSLINALTKRRSLARVSQSPGCTRQINFFKLPDVCMLVDLPGYGFARISGSQRNQWDNLIHHYLRGRTQLKRVFLLIDSRHPIKEIDIKTMKFLDDYAISYQIVLTKVDKSEILESIKLEFQTISQKHGACHPVILSTSSLEKIGLTDIQGEMLTMM